MSNLLTKLFSTGVLTWVSATGTFALTFPKALKDTILGFFNVNQQLVCVRKSKSIATGKPSFLFYDVIQGSLIVP